MKKLHLPNGNMTAKMIDLRDDHKESLFLSYAKKLMMRAKSIGYQSPRLWRNLAVSKTLGPMRPTGRIST
ncbi:MAG TPA: hypothetical protein DEO73_17160 [Pantoea sp.]|nr:hypothetical protein [Pantoea sp.]